MKGLVEEWRNRPVETFYPVVFIDALGVNIPDEGHISKKAVYLALEIRLDGQKEQLGMWIERNEGSKFWMGILNELKNRGVQDVLIAAVDGLQMQSTQFFQTQKSNCAWYTWSATQ